MSQDLKEFIAQATPMFDDPDAASREAFQIAAAIASLGTQAERNLAALAGYLRWTPQDVAALAQQGVEFRNSTPPMLRRLIAAEHKELVEAYALFLVQVTRLACLQFAPTDTASLHAASAIAATVTRRTPVSNTGLEPTEPAPAADADELGKALDELEQLVGLEDAKREINQQVQLIRIAQLREKAGLRNPTVSRHLVFVGNPGTGKTTVARLVGRIYRALGVVADGHLVECDASGLIAGFIGQTAIKTQEQISKAIGGILFIDEAYGLVRNDFGVEAIDTLVKGMEDNRDSLVVIAAGYTANMHEFIEANPGLQSRFPTTITFMDYTPIELVQILQRMCEGGDYGLAADAEQPVQEAFAQLALTPDFGNARTVRNIFEAAVRQHAWRLRDDTDLSLDEMRTLTTEDVLSAIG